ncbi:hypothetical protein BC939DRAFT_504975 [Gamsiella multidivaricata]|uniref:uncharacterized protein n=1 Tax=Gamsiella multidivaricata TaxID=101098 RepID=UPI0022209FF6|nr:uncharacterized protein BC939DRAFT_504975 [Gamsiella multidivaricata]KAI7820556.1 hypothetical protein BC939DRAFT_504975 [Gamsiella multidivaricata]
MESVAHSQGDIQPPCSASSTCSTSSTSSCPGTGICKSVQFSRFIKISFTYPGDEYDRSALEPSKLTTSEVSELKEMRSHWRQEMNERLGALERPESPASPVSPISPASSPSFSPLSSSSYPQESHPFHSRIHPHALLQPASSTCSHVSPTCSPVLSHLDSSSSSEDEYEPVQSSQQPHTLTAQQQQQYQRLKRFSGSRNSLNGMMHRHSHLNQSKENVQCIA